MADEPASRAKAAPPSLARDAAARLARRSRLVRLLTIMLPVAALALIGLIFAWSGNDDSGEIPLTFEEADLNDANPRMEAPRLKGADEEGRPYTVTAESAVQTAANAEKMALTRIEADMVLEDNGWMFVEADRGTLDRTTEMLALEGGIALFSADGFEMHTSSADIDLKGGKITTRSAVELFGGMGEVRAGGLTYDREKREAVFSGGVTTIFEPASREGAQ